MRMKWFATVADQNNGVIDFDGHNGPIDRSVRPGPPSPEGLDITITTKGDEPCQALYIFEREIMILVGDKVHHTKELTIPLNGRTTKGRNIFQTIKSLEPGESWHAPDNKGCWSADPDNLITEIDESNNLFNRN